MGKYGCGFAILRGAGLLVGILFCFNAFQQIRNDDYLFCLISVLFVVGVACVILAPKWSSLLGFVPPLLVFAYAIWLGWRENEALRPIGEMAVHLTQSRLPQGGRMRPSAKAVVWDPRYGGLSSLHYQLPRSWRGRSTDSPLTIFVVTRVTFESNQNYEEVGRYRSRRFGGEPFQPAVRSSNSDDVIRETIRIGVVNWPEGTFVEWREIQSQVPSQAAILRSRAFGRGYVRASTYFEADNWLRSALSPPEAPFNLAFFLASFLPPPGQSRGKWTEGEARAEAMRRYPELKIANSPLNKAYVERYRRKKQENPAFFSSPDWPIRLADELGR